MSCCILIDLKLKLLAQYPHLNNKKTIILGAPTITPRQRHAKPAKESKQRLVDTVAVRDIMSRLRPAIQTNIKTEKPKPEPPQPEVNGNEPQGVRAMMAKFSTMASTPAPGPKSPPPSVIPPKPPGGVTMPRGAVENSYDETRGFGNHGNTQHRVLPPPPTPKRLDSDSGSGTGSPFDSGNGTICPAPPPLNTMPDVAGRSEYAFDSHSGAILGSLFFSFYNLSFNPYPANLIYLNFHPLEVVSRYRDTQPQVGGKLLYLLNMR